MSVIPINTVDEGILLTNLQAFLVAHGIGRDPRDGSDLTLPPIWREPRKGIPYPTQTEGLEAVESAKQAGAVIALQYATEVPSAEFEGFISRQHVTIWYRTTKAPAALTLHKRVKDLLHDQRNYSLNGLQVNQSMLFRGLQPLGSDDEGWMFNCELEFTLWSYAD